MQKEARRYGNIPAKVKQRQRRQIGDVIEAWAHFIDPRWRELAAGLRKFTISEQEEVIRSLEWRPYHGRPRGAGKGKRAYDDESHAREFEARTQGLTDKAAIRETREGVVSRMDGRGKDGKFTTPKSKARRLRRARAELKADRTDADKK